MRTLAIGLRRSGILAVALILAGCAGNPTAESDAAYEAYWRCAYGNAMAQRGDMSRSAPAVAAGAQAQCRAEYDAYRQARRRYSRSVVPDSDRVLAERLADQAARERRHMVTRRLTALVAESR